MYNRGYYPRSTGTSLTTMDTKLFLVHNPNLSTHQKVVEMTDEEVVVKVVLVKGLKDARLFKGPISNAKRFINAVWPDPADRPANLRVIHPDLGYTYLHKVGLESPAEFMKMRGGK